MIAYHGTKNIEQVMQEGLVPYRGSRFPCICLADKPEIAAAFGIVLVVDITGLLIPIEGFVGGEMRLHQAIDRERLTILQRTINADLSTHVDPWTYPGNNHPTCLRIRCWE